MTGLFVSYRRDDTQGWAGRFAEALSRGFPAVPLFMDLSAIKGGDDFANAIEQALGSSQVLLALIGPRWLTAAHEDGTRRLEDPDDFVRLEIRTALERGVRVVPVLVGGARMPRAQDLPSDLSALSRRQAHEVTDIRWDYDCDQLLGALEQPLGTSARRTPLQASTGITVGSGLVIKGSKVGDITGVKMSSGSTRIAGTGPIDVASNARIEGSEIGNITGVKQDGTKTGE